MSKKLLLLFDVDGTLTKPRAHLSHETSIILNFLSSIRSKVKVGVVGGSDLCKIKEQLGNDVNNNFDYSFSENGLVAYINNVQLPSQSIRTQYNDVQINKFVNFVLKYIANLDIPIKRGTFIEFRTGMINVSPIGRNCNQVERDEYEKLDKLQGIREKFVDVLQKEFEDMNFTYSIGGQISFDVFPKGWDKTFCLNHIDLKSYDEIHFFGDKTYRGGNDHEIFIDPRVIGHTVTGPEDTMKQVSEVIANAGL